MLSFLFEFKYFLYWVLFNFIFSLYVYNKCIKYYENPKRKNTSNERDIIFDTNIHEKYPEWIRLDKLSFRRLFLGLVFLFWPKFIIICVILLSIVITIKIMRIRPNEKEISHIKRKILVKFNNLMYGLALLVIGLKSKRVKNRYDAIYQKYLGPYYNSSFDKNYSIIISNHFSWIEILYYLKIFSPGFISKESVRHYFLIGEIATAHDCLFLDRTNLENRTYVVFISSHLLFL